MSYMSNKMEDITSFISSIDEVTLDVNPGNISRVRMCLAELFVGSEATLDECCRIQNLSPNKANKVWIWSEDELNDTISLEDRDSGFIIRIERSPENIPWRATLTLTNITKGTLYWHKKGTGLYRLLGQGIHFEINKMANAA